MKLFFPYTLGNIELKNRLVMAPMTRSRAIGNVPNDLMAEYYAQRADNGLIVTEGTSPSPNGLGYPRIPGVFSTAQIEGWKLVTDAVHARGGRIFVQLIHVGRIGHAANLPEGAEIVAPSPIAAPGEMYTDSQGPQSFPEPREMNHADIQQAVEEFAQAARNAIAAGFDGVEIHGANGYLVEQFINTATNQRSDEYGGSIENRIRFALQVAQAVVDAIGAERTGIRLSPFSTFNGTGLYPETTATYIELASQLNQLGLVYLHFINNPAMGSADEPESLNAVLRDVYKGTIIRNGGYEKAGAESDLQAGHADLIAFGRPALANPDLLYRLENDLEMNQPDFGTLYTPGAKGYTDYAAAAQ